MNYQRQQGVVLVIALMILLMLGFLASSSLNSTILQEKMVSSLNDDNRAFQGAESALAFCEKQIDGLRFAIDIEAMPDVHHQAEAVSAFGERWWQDTQFWLHHGMAVEELAFADDEQAGALVQAPQCYVELLNTSSSQQQGMQSFYAYHAGVDDVMADSSGDAQRAAGVYHFRITARSVGSAFNRTENESLAVVLQSHFIKRLY